MLIEGVQSNNDFLINVLEHDMFKSGNCDTKFIDDHPELFNIQAEKSQAYDVIRYFGEMAVNETFGSKPDFDEPEIPEIPRGVELRGTKQILDEQGPDFWAILHCATRTSLCLQPGSAAAI